MPSIFASTDGLCGIFAPATDCNAGTQRVVTFSRAAHLVASSAPVQNASGEVVVTFVPIGTYALDWQPQPAGVLRQIHGQVVEVAARAYGAPAVDIRALDRCTVNGTRLECVNVLAWGDHTEWEFRALGR